MSSWILHELLVDLGAFGYEPFADRLISGIGQLGIELIASGPQLGLGLLFLRELPTNGVRVGANLCFELLHLLPLEFVLRGAGLASDNEQQQSPT